VTSPGDGPEQGPSGLPPHLDPRRPRAQVPRRDAAQVVRPRQRSRARRFGRVLSWIALTMSVLILGLAGVGYVLLQHYDGNIRRIDVFSRRVGAAAPPAAPHDAMNFLLVGSDSRAGANGAGTGGSGLTAGERSDTIILAHLFGSTNRAELVSVPRDAYVEIPAYTDATGTKHQARHDKVNSAIAEGGPALLIATVEKLSGIRVDHYVQIDFSGFKNMVNKLGGVDVCLSKDQHDVLSHLDLAAGRHHIDGNVALAFVRQRHGLTNGDIDRIGRQQQLLGSLVHRVLSAGTLLNPLRLNGFIDVTTQSLQFDKGLQLSQLRDLALRLKDVNSKDITFTSLPIADLGARVGSALVVQLDSVKSAALFDGLRQDQVPGTRAAPKGPNLTVPPGGIRVRVFNGSGVSGQARKAFTALAAAGFVTTGVPASRGSGLAVTTIHYGPTKADSAATLAAAIPGAVLAADASLQQTLEVVVGTNYTGVQKVTVKAPKGPAPGGADPLTKTRTAADDPCTGA